jgi:hypothetical protein
LLNAVDVVDNFVHQLLRLMALNNKGPFSFAHRDGQTLAHLGAEDLCRGRQGINHSHGMCREVVLESQNPSPTYSVSVVESLYPGTWGALMSSEPLDEALWPEKRGIWGQQTLTSLLNVQTRTRNDHSAIHLYQALSSLSTDPYTLATFSSAGFQLNLHASNGRA